MSDIQTFYPDAKESDVYAADCVNQLQKEHKFDLNKTILATSVCSDEVIETATNFRKYLPLDEPFQMGGLAGYPFAGVTGLTAFAGHIPDEGSAIVIYGPHIGFSGTGQVGKIKRVGQKQETTCCGALVAVVNHFQSGATSTPDKELDYQQWTLTDNLKDIKGNVHTMNQPLVDATNTMYDTIHVRMDKIVEKMADKLSGKKVAFIGGIIINTDAGEPDWFEQRNFEVKSF